MNQTCPQCFSQLATSEVGNLCVNCGYLQRRLHNHAPIQNDDADSNHHHQHADHVSPVNLEAPRGLDELLFNQAAPPQASNDAAQTVDINQRKPQIINHRMSSQYRRRLEQQIETLKTPEIESSIEPKSSLEAGSTPLSTTTPAQEKTKEPATLHNPQQDLQKPVETTDVVEVSEPHRPSPYLLNMSETEPEHTVRKPEYHSPLDSKNKDSAAKKSGEQPVNLAESVDKTPDSALARADALLAAAASPQKASTSANTNYLIIGVTIVILLGIGSFLAFTLLRRPAVQSTTSVSPVNSPSTTQNSSPTPTNLTESAKRDAERKDTLNTIAIALAAYRKANGTYPSGNDIDVLSALTNSNPPYLREIKTDPLSNSQSGVVIKYGYNSDGTKFTLTASLENKQDTDAVNGLYVVKSP